MSGCTNKTAKVEETPVEENIVRVSKEQFKAVGMELGSTESRIFSEEVNTTGYTTPSPDGVATVHTLVPGIVSGVRQSTGSYVSKGDVLFGLGGANIINLQQEYIKSCSELDFKKQELERVKKLINDEISAAKTLLPAKNEYTIALSERNGKRTLLEMMNIDPEKVENGNVFPTAKVVAPISGYITAVNLENGQYAEPGLMALKIVDTSKLKLKLNVFKSDIRDLLPGQDVVFYNPDYKTNEHRAKLVLIGKEVDPVSKTINCIASIEDGTAHNLINGMFVESRIITCRREAMALPEKAVFDSETGNYVFVKTGEGADYVTFKKLDITTGTTNKGYIEVVDDKLENVLTEGGYYLTPGE